METKKMKMNSNQLLDENHIFFIFGMSNEFLLYEDY